MFPCSTRVASAGTSILPGPPKLIRRTLTNRSNQRLTWLDLAHRALDHAVLDAYGWPHDPGDDDILARLLALNVERATAQAAADSA
jgi:hypothetical protein